MVVIKHVSNTISLNLKKERKPRKNIQRGVRSIEARAHGKKQFKGVRLTEHHIKNYHKAKSREDINQFFLDWIINPVPIL